MKTRYLTSHPSYGVRAHDTLASAKAYLRLRLVSERLYLSEPFSGTYRDPEGRYLLADARCAYGSALDRVLDSTGAYAWHLVDVRAAVLADD